MRPRHLALVLVLAFAAWLVPETADADLKLATFQVKGMVWQAWPANIATALERLPGVKRADVKLETGQAKVTYDDTKQSPEKLAAAIDKLGFRASVVSVTDAPKGEAPPGR